MEKRLKELERLRSHLRDVQNEPSTLIDEKQIDTAIYALVPILQPEESWDLIIQSYQLLSNLQQDPDAVIRLLDRLLQPVSLVDVLALNPPPDLVTGLSLAARPFNRFTLNLIGKADGHSAQTLASAYPQLFVALVVLWLSSTEEGTAEKAGDVLLHLLNIDRPDFNTIGRDGPVWKRVFRDKDVYERIYALTDTKTVKDTSLSKAGKTIAQARLLDWLPKVSILDWDSITQSYHPEIEASFGLTKDQRSLLDFALSCMVDINDTLMYELVISACEMLLRVNPQDSLSTSQALEFLKSKGHHDQILRYYLKTEYLSTDPMDIALLVQAAAKYTACWVEIYPRDLEQPSTKPLKDGLLAKIDSAVSISAARWAHGHSPSDDLHVLASLPRTLLASLGPKSPVALLPTKVANGDALRTLATIFHGPPKPDLTIPPTPPREDEAQEIRAAEALYQSYLSQNPHFWTDIVTHADTIALKDNATASINLVAAILTARWDGTAAILDGPGRATVIPWLLAPPKTFSNLIGGRGDAENAAYRIVMAKFDCLKAFHRRVQGREAHGDIARLVETRLGEGPWGKRQEVGARIATLEL